MADCQSACYDYSGFFGPGTSTANRTIPKRDITRTNNANPELIFFNWERDRALADYGGNYFYDSSAGEDIPVYIIDRGANLDSVRNFLL